MSGGGPRIGVCSWSLRPDGPAQLVERVRDCGLGAVQLALDPIRRGDWDLRETLEALGEADIVIASAMMAMEGEDYSTLESIRATGGLRPDATWPANLAAAEVNAELARDLGADLVTFHAGFIPEAPGDELDAMLGRIERLADVFADRGVRIAFETGQEAAPVLLALLDRFDPRTVGVNFDPANMILYGSGDPIEAFAALAPRVFQVHVKDAVPTGDPGTWGRETIVGEGAVDWEAFFGVHQRAGLAGDLIIEREGGPDRAPDVRAAKDLVERRLGAAAP